MTCSEAIKQARMRAGMSQSELGKRMGVSQQAIAKLESSKCNPTINTLIRVGNATGTTPVFEFTRRK